VLYVDLVARSGVIHGDHDASIPFELSGMKTAALIAGCRVEVYDKAPHGLPLTHVDRLNRDLFDFAKQ
jgi:pimeloyl-ACP methyl ester carboxylesterase